MSRTRRILRALGLCARGHLRHRPSGLVPGLLFPLGLCLLLFSVGMFIADHLGLASIRGDDDSSTPNASAPVRLVVDTVAALVKPSAEERAPAAHALRVHVQGPPELRQATEEALRAHEMRVVEPVDAQVTLRWHDDAWHLDGVDPVHGVLAWHGVQKALSSANDAAHRAKGEMALITYDAGVKESAQYAATYAFIRAQLLFSFMTGLVAMWAFTGMGMSQQLEKDRASGLMESLALSPMPLWPYFLTLVLSRAIWLFPGTVLMLLVPSLFLPAPAWGLWGALPLLMVVSGLVLGTLGIAWQLMFRHPHVRVVVGLALNPFCSLIPTLMLVLLLGSTKRDQAVPTSLPPGTPPPFVDLPLLGMSSGTAFQALGCVVLIGIPLLVLGLWVLEKKLGRRRSNLAAN